MEDLFKYQTPDREFIYGNISLNDLAVKWGLDIRKLNIQAKDEDWEARKKRFRDMLAEEEDLQNIEPKKLMDFRHLKIYRLILEKAKKILEKEDFESVEKAAEAADKAVKGERLIGGQATERTEETLGVSKETLKEIGKRIVEEKLKRAE